ncbi:hypothetical protein KY290_025299 [Solanum tuberosum]|uniref:Ubiquitin-like protease family profile domain-containing protein n=1 Tax=Solanum tuberosum TaxID=4113 RepID=A0ABQ7UTD4_SOLTU|nr:hypothetical protein KY290_025299 [Solanum tuberosum]
MSHPMKCWTDQYIDVIFYYLHKKSKLRSMDQYRYTTVNYLFKSYINIVYKSGFFDKMERTNWASLEVYKDKETGELLGPQQLFKVEYAQDIMQQQSDSLLLFDCGMYVVAFTEFLSDEINIPSISFQSDYLRNRYATLLWKYGMDKAKAGYVSDNDDPTRPKSDYTSPAEDGLINVE